MVFDRRKRARLDLIERLNTPPDLDDEELSFLTNSTEDFDEVQETPQSLYVDAPRGFLCPLTLQIMFDPVLDAEGNAYERRALFDWLKKNRISPISRQPLSQRMVMPNYALRDAIHEFMGRDWVARKQSEIASSMNQSDCCEKPCSRFRAKIDCYLQSTSREIGGLRLRLNDQGCCAFRYDNLTFAIDVPEQVGVFCFYTRELVPTLTDRVKDRLLELNFLQGDTRGGCLSVKKHENGRAEVVFSYTDRVNEVSGNDFSNILLNFVETAVVLRDKLLADSANDQKEATSEHKSVEKGTVSTSEAIATTSSAMA